MTDLTVSVTVYSKVIDTFVTFQKYLDIPVFRLACICRHRVIELLLDKLIGSLAIKNQTIRS